MKTFIAAVALTLACTATPFAFGQPARAPKSAAAEEIARLRAETKALQAEAKAARASKRAEREAAALERARAAKARAEAAKLRALETRV
jgi:hypothetical protein